MAFCPYCGTKAVDGAIFCKECGKRLTEEEPSPKAVSNDEFDMFGDFDEDDFFSDSFGDIESTSPIEGLSAPVAEDNSTSQIEQASPAEEIPTVAEETLQPEPTEIGITEELSPSQEQGITQELKEEDYFEPYAEVQVSNNDETDVTETVSPSVTSQSGLGRGVPFSQPIQETPRNAEKNAILYDEDDDGRGTVSSSDKPLKKAKKEKPVKEKKVKELKVKKEKKKKKENSSEGQQLSVPAEDNGHSRRRRRSAREEERERLVDTEPSLPLQPKSKIQKVADANEDDDDNYVVPEEYADYKQKSIEEAASHSSYVDERAEKRRQKEENQKAKEEQEEELEGRRKLEVKPVKRRKRERNYDEIDIYKLEQEKSDIEDSDYDGYYENILPIDHDRDKMSSISLKKIISAILVGGVLLGVIIFVASQITAILNL